MDAEWTLKELVAEAAAVLRGYAAATNGQVKAIPDERGVRYYASLGLLDRPNLRGRTAYYGRRHLAQLVAIKRLQAVGKSLHELAAIVPALDDAALARASGVAIPAPAVAPATRAGFWRGPVVLPSVDQPDTAAPTAERGDAERAALAGLPSRAAPETLPTPTASTAEPGGTALAASPVAPSSSAGISSSIAAPGPAAGAVPALPPDDARPPRGDAADGPPMAARALPVGPGAATRPGEPAPTVAAPSLASVDAPVFAAQLALALAPGVTLTFTPSRVATDADADALVRAATALVAELRRRRLIPAADVSSSASTPSPEEPTP